jgi:polysaccharide biosynthesis protein PslG
MGQVSIEGNISHTTSRAYQAGWLIRRYAPYLVRLMALMYILSLLTPAPPRVIPEAPQTVQTAHPVVCAHTRLTDEVEDWKVQRTLQFVREMGATTIVELFPWAYIEGREDTFDWHHPDRIIEMAHNEGLQVIARLGIVPAWARPDPQEQPTTLNYLPPESYGAYGKFVATFAARYRGKVDRIIPWNEPNLTFEWGDRQVSPEEYVQFLKIVYQAAHAANPDVIILGGALAPTLEAEDSPVAMNDLDYLRRLYQAGGGAYMDALAIHTYGFTSPMDDPPAPDKLNFRRFELLVDVMKQFGVEKMPIYITESSWNDHPRWTNAVTPGQRVEYTLEAIRYVETQWPTVQNLCFWYFRAPTLTRSYPDYFAFVTPEFRLKPIYEAVQAYARGWSAEKTLR